MASAGLAGHSEFSGPALGTRELRDVFGRTGPLYGMDYVCVNTAGSEQCINRLLVAPWGRREANNKKHVTDVEGRWGQMEG